MTQTPGGVPARDPRGRTPSAPSEGEEIYRIPARSVGCGAVIRRRTPAGAWVDFVIDRIELRPGDEVRIDMVDPATGWGAFLVLDGNADLDIVGADMPPDDVEAVVIDNTDDDVWEEVPDAPVEPDDALCVRVGVHVPSTRHRAEECRTTDLADPDADPREMCLVDTIAGKCARWADHDGVHRVRILMTTPHDGHAAWEICPACPHPEGV